eukprot:7586450-Pyramimonas_sp.AAC.1
MFGLSSLAVRYVELTGKDISERVCGRTGGGNGVEGCAKPRAKQATSFAHYQFVCMRCSTAEVKPRCAN